MSLFLNFFKGQLRKHAAAKAAAAAAKAAASAAKAASSSTASAAASASAFASVAAAAANAAPVATAANTAKAATAKPHAASDSHAAGSQASSCADGIGADSAVRSTAWRSGCDGRMRNREYGSEAEYREMLRKVEERSALEHGYSSFGMGLIGTPSSLFTVPRGQPVGIIPAEVMPRDPLNFGQMHELKGSPLAPRDQASPHVLDITAKQFRGLSIDEVLNEQH